MKRAIGWFVVLALLAVLFSFAGCATQEEKKPASAPAPEKTAAPAPEKTPAPTPEKTAAPTPEKTHAPTPKKTTAPTAAQKRTQSLFIIERSKNANVVHYDARLTAAGKLDPKEPVIAYWVMRAEDGRRQELSWIEKKKGYGFDIKPDQSVNGYKMTLMAAPQKQITVKKAGGAIRAEVVIGGRPAVLKKIYINASGGLTGPTVHYLEIYGKDVRTAKTCFEKIIPK